ncbi:MAG: putative glycoside hydrolase [Candidatus Peregrinibacteria bacterium]
MLSMFTVGLTTAVLARGWLPASEKANTTSALVAYQREINTITPFRSRMIRQQVLPVILHGAPDVVIPQAESDGVVDPFNGAESGGSVGSGAAAGFSVPSRMRSSLPLAPLTSAQRIEQRRQERISARGISSPLSPQEIPPLSSSQLPPPQIGVYMTPSSIKNEKFFTETLDHLGSLSGAALVFDVKGGKVFFHSNAEMATKLGLVSPTYDLEKVLSIAHERGIYTIGRFIAVKDPSLAQALPEIQIRHPLTDRSVGNVWVDPGNGTVLAYNEEIIRELARAGIDEINLDYIRYPTEYAQASIGLHGAAKSDHLEKFIEMARRVIDEEGGRTKLGISAYAILGWDYPINLEAIGQDVVRFAPLLDVISPMAYPATFAEGAYYNPARHPVSRMYYLVYRTLTGYRELLGEEHAWKLRPWIQGYGITSKNLKDEIQAVFDSGSCGFQIWSAGNNYGTFYNMLDQVKRPEACGV